MLSHSRGPYRIQHSGDKHSHQKRMTAGAPKNHVHVYPVLHPALYSYNNNNNKKKKTTLFISLTYIKEIEMIDNKKFKML